MGRLLLLDGMRGAAAFAVMAFHLTSSDDTPFSQAWLAVDFFFLLSGFVLARAYGAKFGAGLNLREYMWIRLRRLYPAILAGLAISVALQLVAGPPSLAFWVQVAFAAVTLPYPIGNGFPLNGVQWSLMFEFIGNAVHSTIPPEAKRVVPPVLVATGAVCLVAAAVLGGTVDGGMALANLWVGFGRLLFSFFAGVILADLHARGTLDRLLRPATVALLAAFALLLAIPGAGQMRELVTIMIAWPAILIFALRVPEPTGPMAALCKWAGWLSYPLYAVHMPILEAMHAARDAFGWPMVVLSCGIAVAVASLVAVLTEPVRRPVPAPAGT